MTNKECISPEEFAEKMKTIFHDGYDVENAHADADDLMCEMLIQFGYGEGVDIFDKVEKWYS